MVPVIAIGIFVIFLGVSWLIKGEVQFTSDKVLKGATAK